MKNIMKYKGFYAIVNYEVETATYWSKIEEIDDLISFEANTLEMLEVEFKKVVDEYIQSKVEYTVAK